MAIIKFVKVRKGNLKNAVKYITQEEKTEDDLIYCKDCDKNNVIEQFQYVKKLYNNLNGRQYYHFIQSFSPNDKLDYKLANDIGKEICANFKDFQIIMATHKDKDYIHNHFIMNSVNFKTGKKYQELKKDLEKIKLLSNEICKRYGLRQINLNKSNISRYKSSKEYHLSKRDETEKQKLIKVINKCIKESYSKKQFIFNMNQNGYKVRWEENRKYITYITPKNIKFRDIRLQNPKYLKEKMDKYFKRLERSNKVKTIFSTIETSNKKSNYNKELVYKKDFSDIEKLEYINRQKNSSSIEWEE